MDFQKTGAFLIVLVVFVAVMTSQAAARVLTEKDFGGSNHFEKYSSIYDKVKNSMALWLERLPSGPSPRGPVESRKGNGQLTACEVILFHHEDMGIPWEIAKFGVKQGMWGAVKKVERGFRAYQKERASGSPLSRPAFMAQINTKIDPEHLKSLENDDDLPETEVVSSSEKRVGTNIPKLIVFGGAVALACSLDRGLLTKAVIFSVARRFANIGRGAFPRTQL